MYFERNIERDGKGTIALMYGDRPHLVWSISKLIKNNVDIDLVLRDINEYWATLDKTVLDSIWDIYVAIDSNLTADLETSELTANLKELIRKMYEIMSYEDMEHWVINHSRIKIPHDQLSTEYTVNAPNNRLTYLENEYMQLLALTTHLRPLIGVFGTYVQLVDTVVGTDFKELSALKLLEDSSIVETAPYNRLTEFVNVLLPSKDISMDALLTSMGSDEMALWLLGFALVRRLPFSELPDKDDPQPAHNVVSNIYNYLASKVAQSKTSFGNNVRDKRIRASEGDKGGIDNSPSVAEIYKMTEEISEGDVIANEYAMRRLIDPSVDDGTYSIRNSNVRRVVHRIDATVPDDLIQTVEEYYLNKPPGDLAADNQHLEKIVMSSQISRSIIPLLCENVEQVAIATLILLWHWELYDLAALATGERRKIPSSVFVGSTKLKLMDDQIQALEKIYPIKVSRRLASRKVVALNQGEITVDELTDIFSATGWHLRVPPKLRSRTRFVKNDYASVVPASIKQQLADLLIKLNEIGCL